MLGLFRMLVDAPVTMKLKGFERGYAQGSFLWVISNRVTVGVSYATPAPQCERIRSLTFGTSTDEDRSKTSASWGWQEVVASAFILFCILGAYLYFRG